MLTQWEKWPSAGGALRPAAWIRRGCSLLERSNGGIRMFRESDFEWLSIIACLKQTGMPIKDIKTFIDWCVEGDATIGQRLGLIDRQRQRVLEQIQQLQETLQVLDYKHWYYEKAREAGSCAIHDSLTEADVPAPLRAAWRSVKGGGR
ncbi:MAG: MerR family transcriptional regulator [Oscillospiraceae bacterium]